MPAQTGVRLGLATLAVAAVAGTAVAVARRRASSTPAPGRVGTSAEAMEYAVFGDGPRSMLLIPGGPGSETPDGVLGRLMTGDLGSYLDAGYTVWTVTRRRHMPRGHTVADMADDIACFIREEMGGTVDVVLGQSFGGMISLYLAANHPAAVRRLVLAGSAATISDWAADIDHRFAALQDAGKDSEAAATLLEYVLHGPRSAVVRRAAGPAVAALLARAGTPLSDLVVETRAEAVCDARPVLGRITSPVLLVCAGSDPFFPVAVVEGTAAAIKDATVVRYDGIGHVRLFGDPRLPADVLAWASSHG